MGAQGGFCSVTLLRSVASSALRCVALRCMVPQAHEVQFLLSTFLSSFVFLFCMTVSVLHTTAVLYQGFSSLSISCFNSLSLFLC